MPTAKRPSTVRIMAIGSSTTFDPGVTSDTLAWPARLQFWLQQRLPSRPVEVINAGVPGYRVVDDLIRFQMDLFRYQPDVIIIYEGHNDLFGALRGGRSGPPPFSQTPDETPAVTPWGRWLSRHSLLYGKLVGRLEVLRFVRSGRAAQTAAPDVTPQAVIDSGAARFQHDLTAFVALVENQTFHPVVVIPQLVQISGDRPFEEDLNVRHMWSYTVPFADAATVLQGYRTYNGVLQAVARRFGAVWIPTDSFGLTGSKWYAEGDPIHFNDSGAEQMAEHLAAALVERHVLPPSTAPTR